MAESVSATRTSVVLLPIDEADVGGLEEGRQARYCALCIRVRVLIDGGIYRCVCCEFQEGDLQGL